MERFLPRIIYAILITVGLVLNFRDAFAFDSTPIAGPENILKSGAAHCPAASLVLKPTKFSRDDFEKSVKAFEQGQHPLTRVDGVRTVFEENLPRMVLYDSVSGFRAEVYLRDQQVAFVWVYAPIVNQGGIGPECHMIEGLMAIAGSAYGKESDLVHWIQGALDESWFRAASNRDPLLQKRFGAHNAAVWGIAPDFLNMYVTRVDDRVR